MLDGPSPRITGRVGFVDGRNASKWEFTLLLGHAVHSLEDIEWADLLPAKGTTGWLQCDAPKNQIEINPTAAIAEPS